MNKETFYNYLAHPELLDDRSLSDLLAVVEEYPYFQSARMLLLKNLNNQGTISYERELRTNAVWITNRSRLFYLLDKRVLLPLTDDEPLHQPTSFNESATIDFTQLSELTDFDILSPSAKKRDAYDKNDELEFLIMSGAAQSGTFFDVGDQVDLEDFKNTFKRKKANEPDSERQDDTAKPEQNRRNALIESFILEQPKIVPKPEKKVAEQTPTPESEPQLNPDMITDTLAKIYIKQGFYDKAIHAYEKLSLKYPEKNSYFAGQINKIKQIINNQ
jgi:tetratricopeptide (TPR) repeat protein